MIQPLLLSFLQKEVRKGGEGNIESGRREGRGRREEGGEIELTIFILELSRGRPTFDIGGEYWFIQLQLRYTELKQ